MAISVKIVLLKILTDGLILGGCGICLLLYKMLGQPFQRGFYCDDQSLMYPFYSSTISSTVLYSVGFILPILLFVLVELRRTILYVKTTSTAAEPPLHVFCKNVYVVLVPFVFGAAAEHLTTDIGKYSIGRLRPHFFDICKPDLSQVDCSKYVTDAVCMGSDYNKEARLSFPSGHASFSMYTMVFAMLYLQARFNFRFSILVKPFIQLLLFFMAFYTCLSRVYNNKHHWSDVLFGALIGIVVAFLIAYRVTDLFPRNEDIPQKRESASELKTTNYKRHSGSYTLEKNP